MTTSSTFHSRWKTYFKILFVILLIGIGIYAFLRGSMFFTNQKIADQQIVLDGQNKQLAGFKTATGYIRLDAVRQLETETDTMPWAERINKVIDMLTELQNINPNQSGSIQLSDFKVSLDSVSLRGKVSSLLMLYYSDPSKGIVSLFDRFEKLDFITDIRIQTYNRTDNAFDFVLEAKVTNDGE